MAQQLKVTAKGQVTLRRSVLDHLRVRPGQKLRADLLPDGRVELRADDEAASFRSLYGILRRPGQPTLTIEEIDEAIGEGVAQALEESLRR